MIGEPARCPKCQDKMDTPAATAGVCYSCHLDASLPPWMEAAEDYTLSSFLARKGEPIPAACRRPRTGVSLLDGPQPPRVASLLAAFAAGHVEAKLRRRMQAYLIHLSAVEGRMGLDDDF